MRKNFYDFKNILIIISFILLLGNSALTPCTVAVISGKITPDGCPLLWKNRDTIHPNNKVVFMKGEKYSFLAVINSEDINSASVWQGINSRGFAIINSASNDLLPEKGMSTENGIFMHQALGTCASVKDFKNMLQTTNGKRRVAANYGVIDAYGNACFFEASSSSYVKFDANDPETAPAGYILRTNFAFTSPKEDMGGGYIRFERISHIFEKAAIEKKLTTSFILQEAARDLVNEKLLSDPLSMDPNPNSTSPVYVRTNDTINRISTISVSVFHGAPRPQKAYLATMWIILGQPVCSVALPLWVHGEFVPDVLGGPETAPMQDLSKKLTSYLYHDQRGNMKEYMNLTRFLNYKDNGFLPLLFSIENKAIAKTKQKIRKWTKDKPGQKEVETYMKRTANKVYQSLQNSFADILNQSDSIQ
ncbi:MAG: carcinine hydrolase/isopenicillin-N N-acyltransferase family protein [Acidobacteriota bacterium]